MNNEFQFPRPHLTVTVTVGEWSENIDEHLAPLIQELWVAGIDTIMSCQEVEPGLAWIEFASTLDVLRFLNRVCVYQADDNSLYHRIHTDIVGAGGSVDWEFRFSLMDIGDSHESDLEGRPVLFEEVIGVYFPLSDLPVILERMREANEIRSLL